MKLRNLMVLITLLAVMAICMCAADAETVQTLNLPTDLKVVGEQAFYQATSLNKVVVPEGTTTIDSKAFAYSSLQEISLPRSITFIAEDAFEGCELIKAVVPEKCYAHTWFLEHGYTIEIQDEMSGVEIISSGECGAVANTLFWTLTDNGVLTISGNGAMADYDIEFLDEDEEYGSSENEFEYVYAPWNSYRGSIIKVALEEGVTYIGESAFFSCDRIKTVVLPMSITEIASFAFEDVDPGYYWSSLRDVYFSGTWEQRWEIEIDEYNTSLLCALWHYSGTQETEIVASGECGAVENGLIWTLTCGGVLTISGQGTMEDYGIDGRLGEYGIYGIDENEWLLGTPPWYSYSFGIYQVVIEEGVTDIGKWAFAECFNLETVNLPNGLINIGIGAFQLCTSLTSIDIPNYVISIGDWAFCDCSSLTEITIPDGVTSIGEYSFSDCSNLTRITIPDGVSSIENGVFSGCGSLKEITFPDGVTSIGEYAFSHCSSLTEITIPDGVTSIGAYAFSYCSNLTRITIPDGVSSIEYGVFSDCSSLKEITFPDGVTSIGGSAFSYCSSLTEITIPDGVTSIGGSAFSYCSNLTRITIPDGVSSIENGVFSGCSSLKEITIPDGVSSIEPWVFSGCSSLKEITIPDGVTGIGYFAFSQCSSLTEITIPDGVTSIGEYAFWDCSSLTEVTIPDGVQMIEWRSFADCTKLRKIYLSNNINTIDEAFENCPVLTIWTEYGSYALQYAKANSIAYYYLSMNGAIYPSGELYKGDPFDFFGYVRSNRSVTSLTASIYSVSQKRNVFSVDLTPELQVCNLNELINVHLPLEQLDLGEYVYTIGASSSLETETFVTSRFTIVPPPRRVNVEGIVAPSGYLPLGEAYTVAGNVTSNYSISSVSIAIIDSGNAVVSNYTATPNASSFDISAAKGFLNLSSLASGEYIFRVTVTVNDVASIAYESVFTVLTEAETAALASSFDSIFRLTSMKEYPLMRTNSMWMSKVAYLNYEDSSDYQGAIKRCLGSLGFKDITLYRYNSGQDTCGHVLGWKEITKSDGGKTRVFAVICRGTAADIEWASNFRVVNSGKYHYGFYAAASDVCDNVDGYVQRHLPAGLTIEDCKVWVTGHSRGAAVANILAGKLLSDIGFENANIYGYTFACPNVCMDDLPACNNVYNYNLGGDLVPRVPLSQWGYRRFGRTYTEHNGDRFLGYNVIDERSMNELTDQLGTATSYNAYMNAVFAALSNDIGLGEEHNKNLKYHLIVSVTVDKIISCTPNNLSIADIRDFGNLIETVKDIGNTHQPETYQRWMDSIKGVQLFS